MSVVQVADDTVSQIAEAYRNAVENKRALEKAIEALATAYAALTGEAITRENSGSESSDNTADLGGSPTTRPMLEDKTAKEVILWALEHDPYREWRYAEILDAWIEAGGDPDRSAASLRTAAKSLKDEGLIEVDYGRITPAAPTCQESPHLVIGHLHKFGRGVSDAQEE